MIVGILSDSHGRLDAIAAVLAAFQARGVELVLHCGDIDTVAAVAPFRDWTTHFVFGNCDRNRFELKDAMTGIAATLHEPFGHLSIDAVEIAWLHGDDSRLMHDVLSADHYDYLFYGHTHVVEQHRAGRTLVVNPGALHRAKVKTCAVLDTKSRDLQAVVIEA